MKYLSSLFFGVLVTIIMYYGEMAFNKWYPITHWVNFISLELQDTEEGSYQLLYSTRRINKPLQAEFFYKTYCKEEGEEEYKTGSDMFFVQKDVPLNPTNGEIKTVPVDMYFSYELKKGNCYTNINVITYINGQKREVGNFITYYTVK